VSGDLTPTDFTHACLVQRRSPRVNRYAVLRTSWRLSGCRRKWKCGSAHASLVALHAFSYASSGNHKSSQLRTIRSLAVNLSDRVARSTNAHFPRAIQQKVVDNPGRSPSEALSGSSTSSRVLTIEPSWKGVGYFGDLISFPPIGYRFEYPAANAPVDRIFSSLSRTNAAYALQQGVNRFVPVQLLLNRSKGLRRTKNLVYSVAHLHEGGRYVLDMLTELPYILTLSSRHFARLKGYVRQRLRSDDCAHIISWVEAGREAIIRSLGEELGDKATTVYWGKPARRFTRIRNEGTVNLLFVNSSNINAPSHFYSKGGKLVLDAFVKLKSRHKNITLTLRSSLPANIKAQYSELDGIRILDHPVPWEVMRQAWISADIFILPNHINTPANVFLDGMSFGLPIVTTDVWANPEIVLDGETGLLVEHPDSRQFFGGGLSIDSPEYRATLFGPNPTLVNGLSDAIERLIEDESLRNRLGVRAREMVESGKFSIKERNARLKRVLDQIE
jgi:glycosyltransferase involved in cell wall biosynthesis